MSAEKFGPGRRGQGDKVSGYGTDHDPRFTTPAAAKLRMIFRFELAGERWNWPVEGEDSIRAFRELLTRAQIGYTVSRDV